MGNIFGLHPAVSSGISGAIGIFILAFWWVARNSISVVYDLGWYATWLVYQCDCALQHIGLTWMDAFVLSVAGFFICFALGALRALCATLSTWSLLLYLTIFGHANNGKFMVFPSGNYAPLGDVVKESNYATEFTYGISTQMPTGMFLLWGCREGSSEKFHLGHGFVADGKIYATVHQIEGFSTFFGGTLAVTRLLPLTPLLETMDIDSDIVQFEGKGFAALFGIKSLKWGLLNSSLPVTIYHFDSAKLSYTQQSAKVESVAGTRPNWILTKSNTSKNDSGSCVTQGGAVVAIHSGDAVKLKCNLALIPLSIMLDAYAARARRFQRIISPDVLAAGIAVESPRTGDALDQRYVELAKVYDETREEEKKERMLGQHTDEQGFRKDKTGAGPPKRFYLKKADWNAIEESDFVAETGAVKEPMELPLKAVQPVVGASEVPPQSAVKTSSVADQTESTGKLALRLHALELENASLREKLSATSTSKSSSEVSIGKKKRKRSKKPIPPTGKSSTVSTTLPVEVKSKETV